METGKCPGMCDHRDLKLKDAEKTIANKDVIIKMLQEHVKKLEESYKRNLKETENFRYKFCIANEQVKKLRNGGPKTKEGNGLVKRKQQCGNPECKNYVQQMKNAESFMKTHYDLIKKLVDKVLEKNKSQPEQNLEKSEPEQSLEKSEPEQSLENANRQLVDEIDKLRQEIDRLKDENHKLQGKTTSSEESLLPGAPLQIKDSVLEAYRRTNTQLQKRVSTLLEKVGSDIEEEEEEEETFSQDETRTSLKRISFSQAKFIIPPIDEDSPLISEDGGVDEKVIVNLELNEADTKNTKTEEKVKQNADATEKCICTDCKMKDVGNQTRNTCLKETCKQEIPEKIEKQTDAKKDKEEKPATSQNKNVIGENTNLKTGVNKMNPKLGNIEKKEEKPDTSQNKKIIEENTNLKTGVNTINQKLGNIEKKEDKPATSQHKNSIEENTNLLKAGFNKINEKLGNIENEVKDLQQKQTDTCDELKVLKNEVAISKKSAQACDEQISALAKSLNEQKDKVSTAEKGTGVMEAVNKMSVGIQQELHNLRCKTEKLCESLNELKRNDSTKFSTNTDDRITVDECIQAISKDSKERERTVTVETVGVPTLYEASILSEDPHDSHFLKEVDEKREREETESFGFSTSPKNDDCEAMSLCSNSACEHFRSELEIEDIYNQVRRNLICEKFTNSSSSCLCRSHPKHICDKEKISDGKDGKDSNHSECGGECLISSLETYVTYLHEQLNIIGHIENQIENLKDHIKNP